jgi:hypothetical protein
MNVLVANQPTDDERHEGRLIALWNASCDKADEGRAEVLRYLVRNGRDDLRDAANEPNPSEANATGSATRSPGSYA